MIMVIAVLRIENVRFKLIQKVTRRFECHTLHLSGRNIIPPDVQKGLCSDFLCVRGFM